MLLKRTLWDELKSRGPLEKVNELKSLLEKGNGPYLKILENK